MPIVISDILKDWKNNNPEKSLNLIMQNSAFLQIDLSKNISSEISKNSSDKDNREDLSAVDFTKLFNEAQNYYKLAKNWKILKCEPKSGFICTKHECKRRDISSYIILDKNKNSITRCDKENCETFEAQFEQTGSFVNI